MAIGIDYKEIFGSQTTGKKAVILKSGTDLVKAELEALLNFKKHSLFFGNDIGLDCEKYLNLTNKVAIFNLISEEIEKLIAKYKRVTLKEISISFSKSESSLLINLTCLYGSSTEEIQVPLVLS
jgi:hypothetical protein